MVYLMVLCKGPGIPIGVCEGLLGGEQAETAEVDGGVREGGERPGEEEEGEGVGEEGGDETHRQWLGKVGIIKKTSVAWNNVINGC